MCVCINNTTFYHFLLTAVSNKARNTKIHAGKSYAGVILSGRKGNHMFNLRHRHKLYEKSEQAFSLALLSLSVKIFRVSWQSWHPIIIAVGTCYRK